MTEQMYSQLSDLRFQLKWACAIAKQMKTCDSLKRDGQIRLQKITEALADINIHIYKFCVSVDDILDSLEEEGAWGGSRLVQPTSGEDADVADDNSDFDESGDDLQRNVDDVEENHDADDERDEETGEEDDISPSIDESAAVRSVLNEVDHSENIISDNTGAHENAIPLVESSNTDSNVELVPSADETPQLRNMPSSQEQSAVNCRIIETFVASPEQDVPEVNECETRCPDLDQLNGIAMDGLECHDLDFTSRYSTEIVHEVPPSAVFTRPDEENLDDILDGISAGSPPVTRTIDQDYAMVNNEYVIPLKRANQPCNCDSRSSSSSHSEDNMITRSNRKKLVLRANPASARCDFSLSLPVRTCGSSVEVDFEDDAVKYSYTCGQKRHTVTCSFTQKTEPANLKRQTADLNDLNDRDMLNVRKKMRRDGDGSISESDGAEPDRQNADTPAGNWGYR